VEPNADDTPLVVIVGQTASGKTALSLKLAHLFGGEIIAADSRTVYKGMDIGTAKPQADEMDGIPHHLIDVVEPDEPFNAREFQALARKAIDDIAGRRKLPMIVGGTGLYVDAVIYRFDLSGSAPDPRVRAELEQYSVEQLQSRIRERGLVLPVNARNPRHLIRTLERGNTPVSRHPLRPHTLVLGLSVEREQLAAKVTARVHAMVGQGLVGEVERLGKRYGWDTPALQAPAYKAFRGFVEGQITLEEAVRLFVQQDMQYAKRQKTWFSRNKDIHWISNLEEAVDIVTTFLNK
jgi:tRNA dimethylallyltransferase